jgi:excisionase family DNA binding protein
VPGQTRSPRPVRTDPQWLSLGEASRLLGVSAATIRRWSDAGRLRAFTTPGGHRRFSKAALERLLPTDRERRPALAVAGLTNDRLARAYRRETTHSGEGGWLAALDPADRLAFRELGRRLAFALVAHLDAADPDARAHELSEATAVAAEYGRRGAELGLSMSDAVEGFLAFRRPFLAEVAAVARRRGFDADEVAGLHDDADRALDRLLVATMSGHSIRTVAARRRRRKAVIA